MIRRYRRVPGFPNARLNVALWDLPVGEGPPILVKISDAGWPRLGPGMGALVGGAAGFTGALAYGLARDLALVWAVHAPGVPFTAYIHHAPSAPVLPALHQMALRRLQVKPQDVGSLYVLVGSQREIEDAEVEAFLEMGVRRDRVLLYCGALIPQIGVSTRGWVGEAA